METSNETFSAPIPVAAAGEKGAGLRWLWVVGGVALGTVLITSLVAVVRNEPPRPDVAIVVGALTFALTGILAGYHSPGNTMAEAGVAGGILGILTMVSIHLLYGLGIPPLLVALGWLVGVMLSVVGGWVGEVLQGTLVEERNSPAGFQWPWVLVGTVLGFMLNNYAVFVLHALLGISSLQVLVAFLASFALTGFFVGYFSPGVTMLEPATAAILVIVLDAVLVIVGFRAPFPMAVILVGGGLAFVVSFAGGYLGEVAQNVRYRRAWDDAPGSYRRVPRPDQ